MPSVEEFLAKVQSLPQPPPLGFPVPPYCHAVSVQLTVNMAGYEGYGRIGTESPTSRADRVSQIIPQSGRKEGELRFNLAIDMTDGT